MEEKCVWYDISRDQRNTERSRGEGDIGTISYKNRGCYNCNGYDLNCGGYKTLTKFLD